MPQTTGQTSWRNAVIEYSTDSITWVDISGVGNKVGHGGGDRAIGEAYTGASDTAILTLGKREPLQLEIDIVYSEATADQYANLENCYLNGTALKLRWAPKGSATGNFRYTSDTGYLGTFTPPVGEYGSGDPILISFELNTPSYSRAAM